jgi:hypothetical protein
VTGACVRSLLEDARGEISAQARPLGASARVLGARGRRCDLWGREALARRSNGAGRAGAHASASRTGKSGRGACSGAKDSGGAFGAAAGAGVLVPREERARRCEPLEGF